MRVWLLRIGEMPALPGNGIRPGRMGHIARAFLARGHEVVWWASGFHHYRRAWVGARSGHDQVGRLRIEWLSSPGYSKNFSYGRLRDHRLAAADFRRRARASPPPDIIIASLPTLQLVWEGSRAAEVHKAFFVVDVRDQWPDVFRGYVPAPLRPAVAVPIAAMRRRAARALHPAGLVVAVNKVLAEHARGLAGPKPPVRVVPLAQERLVGELERNWRFSPANPLRIAYAGGIRRSIPFDFVVDAARRLHDAGLAVEFVLAGDGDDLARLRGLAEGLPTLRLPGWLDQDDLAALFAQSHAGLLPYAGRTDLAGGLPNKLVEYLAGSLGIVTSIEGDAREQLQEKSVARFYVGGNGADLARTVQALAADSKALQEMSRRAGRWFAEELEADAVYGRLVDDMVAAARESRAGRDP